MAMRFSPLVKIFALSAGLLAATTGFAQQQGSPVPEVATTDLAGTQAGFRSFLNPDGPTIVTFWATWCKPCILEMQNLQLLMDDLVKETGVKVVAISIDDSRSQARVRPMVNSRGWPYTILMDPNADLKRAFNVNNIPHTFLVDKEGRIQWQHASYNPGDEEELADQVRALVAKK